MISYLGKIAYHLACDNIDKVNYFFERQVKAFGPITGDEMRIIIKRRDDIVREWVDEMNEFNTHLG